MAPYNASHLKDKEFRKYIRVGETIFVGENEDVGHQNIVEQDGLATSIDTLKFTDPTQLDAGMLDIRYGEIDPRDNSTSLKLPVFEVREEARQITRELLAAQSPNHTIRGLERR